MSDNPPAFPQHEWCGEINPNGMSLRDWFAGQALGSIPLRNWHVEERGDQSVIEAWAECAYLIADAMLAARSKGEQA